jgi:uncharacterized protein YjdB
MPFTFKLSMRLARMKVLLVLGAAAAVAACTLPDRHVTGPNPPTVVQVITSPDSVTLDPFQTYQFQVFGRTQAGDSVPVSVRWAVSAGVITQGGTYTADTSAADAILTATLSSPNVSATSRVRKRRVILVVVSPKTATLVAGGVRQFAAYGRTNTGDSVDIAVSYSATGGTISGSGSYTAGPTPGVYTVIARQSGGLLADTAAVTVSIVPVASVTVSPATASLTVGQTAQLAATPRDASGTPLSGRAVTWATSNAAVATVNSNGLVTGATAGSANITATSEGQGGTAAITVTAPVANPAAVTNLAVASATTNAVTLSFTEVTDGAGQPASYVIRWAVGTLSWASATNVAQGTCAVPLAGTAIGATRTCTVLGLAAATSYQFQLVAFRGTVNVNAVFGALSNVASGTTAASTAPVATVSVSPASATVGIAGTQQFTATLRDASGTVLTGRAVTWASNNLLLATVSGSGLASGLVAGTATITATSEGQSGSAAITVTSGGGGAVLFQETFEDNAFAARGWYDNTSPVTTTAQHLPGSTRALEMHYLPGATTPVAGGSTRHLFPATPTVYVSYWVKYSSNWVGSGQLYHPHEFLIMSDLDGDWDGPSNGWLVAYIEHNYQNGGIPRLQLQDNKAINTSFGPPPINLVGVTENRSTSGCNGVVESNVVATCFNMPPWYNGKELHASQVWFQPNPGPGYKGDWNHVEAYFQINSIAGGTGVADGVMQYWFNGTLVLDRHDILFRTGARPSINFHQFLIAPYIGDRSPVDQYMWVDNLMVATSKP